IERGSIPLHIVFRALGMLLFLFNWTRHAIFSTIRNTENRMTKVKLDNLSKKIVPYHRWIGTTSLILIIIHTILVINLFGFNWQNIKLLSNRTDSNGHQRLDAAYPFHCQKAKDSYLAGDLALLFHSFT